MTARWGHCGPPEATEFRLWAPTARAVQLFLYPDGGSAQPLLSMELARRDRGVWQCRVPGNLDGQYYDFTVTDAEGVTRRTCRPLGGRLRAGRGAQHGH